MAKTLLLVAVATIGLVLALSWAFDTLQAQSKAGAAAQENAIAQIL